MAAPTEKQGDSETAMSSTTGSSKLQDTICFRYFPLAGGASNVLFSTNIMNPAGFKRVFAPFDHVASNALWFNAHLGVGLYIFSRKHMRRAEMPWRITYSVFGAVIYNFGTLLFWATTKAAILPNNATLRTLVGVGSGCAFLYLGHRYLKFVDKQSGNALNEE